MSLWRLYYHLVWATKERLPLITGDIENELYGYIKGKIDSMGCILHSINGTENHVHLIVSIPPRLSITDFVANVKGSSAHFLTHDFPGQHIEFSWQRGYGVFFSGREADERCNGIRKKPEDSSCAEYH